MEDSVVLIVGGTGDIGSACVRKFADENAKVVIGTRDVERGQRLADEITSEGGEVYVKKVDVTDLPTVAQMAREVVDELGGIDVLVNAFGVGIMKPMLDIRPETARDAIDVNVFGTFLVTQTVLRYMETERKGRIVMLPGIQGKYPMKNTSIFTATQQAISGFTRSLVKEQKRGYVKYTLIYLGGVDTGFWDSDKMEVKVNRDKMLQAGEVADTVYYAVNQSQQTAVNEIVLQPQSYQMA